MARRPSRSKQDIPSAQNFSPNEIDLPRVLELVDENRGDRRGLDEAVRLAFYADRPIPSSGGTVWQNVVLGMIAYGVITPGIEFTDVGERLYGLRQNGAALYREMARHLILNVKGAALIECLLDMQRSGEAVNLVSIRERLEERGIHTSTAGKSVSMLRTWLAKAGLFRSQWVPNAGAYHSILGQSEEDIAALAALTDAQRAVLRMLASLGPGHYDSSDLRRATEHAHGVRINEKQFPKDVLYRLRDLGYVTVTKKGGRARTLDVVSTDKVAADVTGPLLDQIGGIDSALRSLIRMSVADIVSQLDSADRHVKGLALEALGFKLMRVVGLNYMQTRYRPTSARFEVDLLFDSAHLAYSRWQVQCKNTDRVSVDDVAKEVGLTYYLLSNVILILTRGKVGEDARRYATDVMRKTNLAIVLIDGSDIAEIVDDPLSVFETLAREAQFALDLKPIETASTPAASSRACPRCQHGADTAAKFCENCGADLGPTDSQLDLNV